MAYDYGLSLNLHRGELIPYDDDKSTSCLGSEKGKTSIHTTETDYVYKFNRWMDVNYSWCEQCKLTEEGVLDTGGEEREAAGIEWGADRRQAFHR